MKKIIINGILVMEDHYIPDAYLIIEDGKISEIGEMDKLPGHSDAEIIDAKGNFVGPGFVDIHSHAGGKYFFYDDPMEAAQEHIKHGVTSVLATLGYKLTSEKYISSLKEIRKLMNSHTGSNIAGVYMEGPYINTKFGAHKAEMIWGKLINPDDYLPIFKEGKDIIRACTVAPEREGIFEFVKDVRNLIPDISFTVGHSEANNEQIERLMPYGLCIGTHHTNATGTIIPRRECRGICVDETVWYNDGIYAELICDEFGMHVAPYMLRLIRKIKGNDKIILISDATWYNNPNPEGYEKVTDLNFDVTGQLAGSRLMMDKAVRNMMKHTGASIVDVFKYASTNPSRAVKLYDRGSIAVGKRADLVIVDYLMNVKSVFLEGELRIAN